MGVLRRKEKYKYKQGTGVKKNFPFRREIALPFDISEDECPLMHSVNERLLSICDGESLWQTLGGRVKGETRSLPMDSLSFNMGGDSQELPNWFLHSS